MELVTLLHKRFKGLLLYIAISLNLGDAIAVIDFAIGTNRDAAKATVAFNKIRGVSLHEVVILGIGSNGVFYLLNSLEE